MAFSALNAISPIDGRYQSKTEELSDYFSESSLIRYRIKVEVAYFIELLTRGPEGLPALSSEHIKHLQTLDTDFDQSDAEWVKETEKITNHDVKAVEYFIKEKLNAFGLDDAKEWVHFALTSQDINNTAIPLQLRDATNEVYLQLLNKLIDDLKAHAEKWKNVSMLARTHGQPASPTQLGKELMVFVERLENQKKALKEVPFSAKFGGATGNFNAHHVAFPDFDWISFANRFVNQTLGLTRSQITTQIEHYDSMAMLFDTFKRINTILIDLSRDFWLYISMDYFKQKIKAGEVGSSAMPHKVNPIDFENAEGNLGFANAIFEHLSAKLPISRLQRDLSDSTVLRNIGVPIAHTFVAIKSLQKGLEKVILNPQKISDDLYANQAVLAEAIQTVLRSIGYPNPYEALKDLTRTNDAIAASSLKAFIDGLSISEKEKSRLRQITPENYTGINLF